MEIQNAIEEKTEISFENIKNMNKILIRRGPNVELADLKVILNNKPGYYSKVESEEEVKGLDKELYFKEDSSFYVYRSGVNFRVIVPGSYEKLKQKMTFSTSMMDKANLKQTAEKMTDIVWDEIAPSFTQRTKTILQIKPKVVKGENYDEDVYAALFSIYYHLIYFVIACNRCEPSEDLDLVLNNFKALDKYWVNTEQIDEMIEILNQAYLIVLNLYVQPFVKSEQEMVGKANLNKNVIEALKLYDLMKRKIDYAMAGQVEDPTPFRFLSDYLNMIIGQEEDFYRMVKLIRREELDKEVSRSSTQKQCFDKRLMIDNNVLESQLLRMVGSVLNYQDSKKEKMDTIKTNLLKTIRNEARVEAELNANRAFIKEMGGMLKESYLALRDLKELNTTKTVNLVETVYQTRFSPTKDFSSRELKIWKTKVLRQASDETRRNLTFRREINKESSLGNPVKGIGFVNIDYETLIIDFLFIGDKEEGDNTPDEIVVEYRIPNMDEDFYDFTDLSWQR